jgi:transcriptional regulator with XRE-family HTH domain
MSWWKDTPEERRAFAEEGLIADATELVAKALEERGWSQKDLARVLHVRPSEITQRLRGKRNLTLRSLAAMLHAMDYDVVLRKRDRRAAAPLATSSAGSREFAAAFVAMVAISGTPMTIIYSHGRGRAFSTGRNEAFPTDQEIGQLAGAS